jgi:hypothetical protein
MTIDQVDKVLEPLVKVIAVRIIQAIVLARFIRGRKNLGKWNTIIEFKDGQVVAKAQAGL